MRRIASLLLPLLALTNAEQVGAQSTTPTATLRSSRQRTYANPIDIDYRYNFEQLNQGISYRSGADPVIVVQRG